MGKISSEDFRRETFRDTNPFASALEKGYSIRSIAFESAGLDADDDYTVFELDIDFGNFRLDTPERHSLSRFFMRRCRMLKRKKDSSVVSWGVSHSATVDRFEQVQVFGADRNLSTTLRHRRFLFTDSFLLLWKWRVG